MIFSFLSQNKIKINACAVRKVPIDTKINYTLNILFYINSFYYGNSNKKINNFFKYTLPDLYSTHNGGKVRRSKLTIQDIIKYLAFYCDK